MHSVSEDDYNQTLSSILEQAVNLSRLVDDLLLLTRAEMNQLNLEVAPVQIMPLLQSEVAKWKKLEVNRAITLIAAPDLNDVIATIDKQKLQQVLSILIDNAIKYSKANQAVEVSLTKSDSLLTIAIKDNGEGISAAEVDNIFERFVRFSKHNEGLGLGLPIAKVIVEAHGGSIVVESSQGQGSIFSIILPIEDIT